MQTNKNVINEPQRLHKRWSVSLLILASVIVLAVGGVLLYLKNHNKPVHYKTIPAANAGAAQQELKSENYKAYQSRRSVEANDLINKGDYKEAEKTLNEITKNVPADKIDSETYRAYWSLYKHKRDDNNRKKYALLTAEKLKAEGQASAAADFEADAKAN